MFSSPAKRRKTSPTTALAIHAPSTPRNDPRITPRRASFLSPTKASLSRFNPNLLPRPSSAGPGATRPDAAGDAPTPLPRRTSQSARKAPTMPNELERRVSRATDGGRVETPITNTQLPSRSGKLRGMAGAPRRASRTPSRQPSPTKLPENGVATQTAEKSTTPRAQEDGPGEDGSGSRRSARLQHQPSAGHGAREEVAEGAEGAEGAESEPDLPLTPTQRGLVDPVMDKAPAGLLNTPSKRPKKKPGSKMKSSPLKSAPARVQRVTKILDEVESDAVSAKTQLRDQLRTQLRRLQEDVARRETELARIGKQENSRQVMEQDGQQADDLMYGSYGLAVSVLTTDVPRSMLLSSNELATDSKQPPPKVSSMSFSAFLPFSARIAPAPPEGPIASTKVPSHRPLELDNPLPYLQAFTPLTYTSKTTILPSASPRRSSKTESNLLQLHRITITSPLHLLSASLAMIVNTRDHTVAELTIEDLSSWAEPELGRWIRPRARGATAAAGKDIAGVCWALGHYWEAAERRARFWVRCERAFGELMSDAIERRSALRATKQSKASFSSLFVDASDEDEDESQPYSRRHLLPHLARQSLVFRRQGADEINDVGPQLRIAWNISFDWTGDAEASISATATAVPESWKRQDSRASLANIPRVFERLRTEKGVWRAVRVVLGLVFPGVGGEAEEE